MYTGVLNLVYILLEAFTSVDVPIRYLDYYNYNYHHSYYDYNCNYNNCRLDALTTSIPQV